MQTTKAIEEKLEELVEAKKIASIELAQIPTEYGWMNAQSYAHQIISTGGDESKVLSAIDKAVWAD